MKSVRWEPNLWKSIQDDRLTHHGHESVHNRQEQQGAGLTHLCALVNLRNVKLGSCTESNAAVVDSQYCDGYRCPYLGASKRL